MCNLIAFFIGGSMFLFMLVAFMSILANLIDVLQALKRIEKEKNE